MKKFISLMLTVSLLCTFFVFGVNAEVFRIVLDNKTTEAKKVSLTFDSQYYENIRRAEEAARAAEEAKRKEREKKNKSFNFGMDKGFDNF